MYDHRLVFNTQEQGYSVVYAMDNDDFRVLHVTSSDEITTRYAIQGLHKHFAKMGYFNYDVVSFRSLTDANLWILSMNVDNATKAKDIRIVGIVDVWQHPEAHVEYYVETHDGRDTEMVYISRNRTYVETMFQKMKHESIQEHNPEHNLFTNNFRMMMALIIPESDNCEYEQIESEEMETFNLVSYLRENA